MLEAYLEMLEVGYYEVTFAFEGLANEHVWKRPAEGLLSVGELAGHCAYWEAIRLAGVDGQAIQIMGEGADTPPDLSKCRIQSPLIDHRFAYLPQTLAASPSAEHLSMTAEQVCAELLRVHKEAVAALRELNPEPDANPPGWSGNWTYREFVKYLAFHIAYHTGQMYSVRHLLGEATPDN